MEGVSWQAIYNCKRSSIKNSGITEIYRNLFEALHRAIQYLNGNDEYICICVQFQTDPSWKIIKLLNIGNGRIELQSNTQCNELKLAHLSFDE